MNHLKQRLEENPKRRYHVGLKTATQEEIEDIFQWLTKRNIPFTHVTYYKAIGESGKKKLPYNGFLKINPKKD